MDATPIAGDHASLLQSSLDHIDQGFSVFDRDLRLVAWNRRFIELIDLPPPMVRTGAPFESFLRYNAERGEYGPGPVDELIAERVRAARAFVRHYLERTRPNGVILAIEGVPLDNGGFVTVYTDITERRRSDSLIRAHSEELETRVGERTAELSAVNEELRTSIARLQETTLALAKTEERLRLITDAIPASIAYIDEARTIRFANRQFAAMCALTSHEVVGRALEEVLGADLIRDLSPHLAQAFSGRTATFDYICGAAGGDTFTAHNVLVPEMGEAGHVLGIFALSLDVTAARKAEAALRDAQKAAAMGQLAGGLAHDFNNLLTVILGNLDRLKRRVDADFAERHIEPAIRAGSRGVDIARRLLAFARRQPLEPIPVDAEDIVTRTAGILRGSLPGSIAIDCAADGAPWAAMADPNQLENALVNLALNARDAMPTGGRLTFHVANRTFEEGSVFAGHPIEGRYVEISVSDTGAGIDAATLARAFEPFFTTKPFGAGSGLGLSMVYGFVRQSGGHIRITSEVGAGTCVSLVLPVAEAPAASGGPGDERPARRGRGELVLLVEADDDVRVAIRGDLLGLGYSVIEARDGIEAEGLLQAVPDVEVLVSGVLMPGSITGWALAGRARAARPGVKVILIGGSLDAADAEEPPPDDVACLRKPFDKGLFARAIEGWKRAAGSTRG